MACSVTRITQSTKLDDYRVINNEVCKLTSLFNISIADTWKNQAFESVIAEAFETEQIKWLLDHAYEIYYDYYREPMTYGTRVMFGGYISSKNLTFYNITFSEN
jgi:hypothetical protein